MGNRNGYEEFDRSSREYKKELWSTGIGLQDVDGLAPSSYLVDIANRHIDGYLSFAEAENLVHEYYEQKETHDNEDEEEASLVAINITKCLISGQFDFSFSGLCSIHKDLFSGILPYAGKIRDVNISKREWVLGGKESVMYSLASEIERSVNYDIANETAFSYRGLSKEEIASHIASFTAGIWQIHPFREGNTRTTAVFILKYLRTLGFTVSNDLFASNSWYFRNALVRACYSNHSAGVCQDISYLSKFFTSLLYHMIGSFRNSDMLVDSTERLSDDACITENMINLMNAIGSDELSRAAIMDRMALSDKTSFRKLYLGPAVSAGIAAMTRPEKPNHPQQRYYLTKKGRNLLRKYRRAGN